MADGRMRALSVRQPWCSAITFGPKRVENRLWPMPEGAHVIRGAHYRWQPGDPTADQLCEAISTALRAHRIKEAVSLVTVLATVDPQRAQDAYDLLAAASELGGS